jgi:acyl-CoA synthetase (NDP forming)
MGAGIPLATALFAPRRVALVGASADEKKTGARPHRFLKKHGFRGEILPVNPGRSEIFGDRAWPDLASIPGDIDHAFILLSGRDAVAAVQDCARRGVAVASILSGGFADGGAEGQAMQRELLDAARASGMRLLGPNSIGVIGTDPPLALTANAALALDRLTPGRLGVVSQSGSLIGALLSRGEARGIGFSKLVSVGNEADLAVGEVADLLVDDAGTDAILLFLETLRDGERVAAMARRAHAAGKPVIAYKLGRSKIGQELARSHTGAIAGSDATFDAFCQAHGIVRVGMFESLIEAAQLLIGRKPVTGRRVAVATTTGGGAAMVVDSMAMKGIEIAPPPAELVQWLKSHRIDVGHGKLVDLTLAGARPDIVQGTISRLLADPANDAVLMVVGSSAQFQPDLAVAPLTRFAAAGKPFAVSLMPAAERAVRLLTEAGVAAFRNPESCAEALACCLLRTVPRQGTTIRAGEAALAALSDGLAKGFDEARATALFAALGVPVAETRTAATPDAAGDAAGALGGPVVLKILSADIAHKTEVGGVALGLDGAASVRDAATSMLARVRAHAPAARIDGFLLQRQERGLAEVIVGFQRDALVGPTITVGLGGSLAEIYKDAATRLAPVDAAEALDMIAEVRGLATIRGYRNLPAGDVAALAEAVAALSWLADPAFAAIGEAEINPLIVRPEGKGVVAVDGLVISRSA